MPILPILAALLLYSLFRRSCTRGAAVVRAAVSWGVLLLLLTELLSAAGEVGAAGIAGGWVAVIVLVAAALRRLPRGLAHPDEEMGVSLWAVIPVALTLAGTLVIALAAPPNSTDSMTYHLTRVVEWIQRRGVGPYATSTVRQIFMPAWAEYAILHFQVLAGGSDRFASLVQWLAFAGCLIVGAEITRQLAGGDRELDLALLFTASLPMVVVQASSTQSDVVTAFWCATFAWAVLAARERPASSPVALPAGALGLAIATKGTAFVVCAPFALWWLASRVRAEGWRRAAVQSAGLGTVVLLLNAPVFARNLRLFHHPLGPAAQRTAHANASHGVGPLASNLVRNATLHLATPSESWNNALDRAVVRLHRMAGLDPSDPRTTWYENQFGVRILRTKESRTGNPLHFLLVGAAVFALWVRPNPSVRRRYALAVLGGAVLFCWIFRWQQWNSRLHVPLFVLAGPIVAAALGPVLSDGRRALLGVALWISAVPWLIANETRPLMPIRALTQAGSILEVPRERQYFIEDPGIEAAYGRVLADLVRTGCRIVGVAGGEKTGVYPLMPLARARGLQLELHYVEVENETRVLEVRPPICALLVEEHPADWRPGPPYDGLSLAWRDERVALWLGRGAAGSRETNPGPDGR